MSAYKSCTGMVSGQCGCEYGGSIHLNAKIVDRNFPLGMHMVVHVLAFCWDDLDIYVVSQAPISMVMSLVDRLAIGFHVLCSSMDCIRPIEHRIHSVAFVIVAFARFAVAFVAIGCHWSSSSSRIALVLESIHPVRMMMATAPPMIVVYCSQPVNLAIDTSWALVDIDSCRWFDAYQVTSLLEWLHHSWLVASE